MTEDTRTPTAKVVITIYDRDVEIEGENLDRLKNSTMHRISIVMKREAKRAKRTVIRNARVEPNERVSPIQTTAITNDIKVDSVKPEKDKPKLADSLQKLGIKLNKSEE